MRKPYKVLFFIPIFTLILSVSVFLPTTSFAATSPSLGTAESYSILAGSEVTNVGATSIEGNVGISPGIGPAPHFSGFGTVTFGLGSSVHDADGDALQAQADSGTAYAALLAQGCDTTYVGVFQELAGLNLVPGVYCADSFHLTAGVLTLNGAASDVWIFKSASDIIITGGNASSVEFTGGGLACNVWWTAVSSTTFDSGSSLKGNILADTSITLAAGATLEGRAFARTGEVTLSGNVVTSPSCSGPTGNLTVVKTVINDNNGSNVVADFNLFVGATAVTSGVATAFPIGNYNVNETNLPGYTAGAWGGDCAPNGDITIAGGDNLTCTITNNDLAASSSGSGGGGNSQPSPEPTFPGLVMPGTDTAPISSPVAPSLPSNQIIKLPVTGLGINDFAPLAIGTIMSASVLMYFSRRKQSYKL